jgi:predicted kinase
MPTVFFLVGAPASGKSTWRDAYLIHAQKPTVVISSDDAIEELAQAQGKTYSETFKTVDFKQIERDMATKMQDAIAQGKDILIDRTNMSRKSRSKWLALIPKTYTKKAVVFRVDRAALQHRLDDRAAKTGKRISGDVVDSMLASFEMPASQEFDEVQMA